MCNFFLLKKFDYFNICYGRYKTRRNKLENKQPSNIEAEQALLGSILVNNDIIDEISSIINSTIFYDPAHIKIYEVIRFKQ